MVDIEKLLVDWLRSVFPTTPVHVDVVPDEPTWPLFLIQLLNNSPSVNLTDVWLTHAWVQIDVYGGTKSQANALATELVQSLPSLVGVHTEGVITKARGQGRSMPDIAYRPPRTRYIVTADISAHP
jgi:hypothetical protein